MLYLSYSPLRSVWLHAQALKKQPPKLLLTQLKPLPTPLLKALKQLKLLLKQPKLLQLTQWHLLLLQQTQWRLLQMKKLVKWLKRLKKLRSNFLSFA